MTLKPGTKVKLTKTCAKWYLDNPEVFFTYTGVQDEVYETVMQYCLLVAMGGDVIGTVERQGAEADIFGVTFKTPFGKDYTYLQYPRDLTVVK